MKPLLQDTKRDLLNAVVSVTGRQVRGCSWAYVRVSGVKSQPLKVDAGLGQGCALSPLSS